MTPINEMRSKFNSLPPFLRALAVLVVLGVLGVTAGAFVYSYNALYAVGGQLGGVERVAWIWPVLIDGQIVVANAGLALAAALGKPKGAMYLWVSLATAASIGFNVWHAGHNHVHWLIAAVAPVTIEGVCFVGVKVLDWIMHALGRPTSWMLPEKPVGYLTPPETTVVQLPGGVYGVPPGAFPGYGPGTFPPPGPLGQAPTWAPSQIPQTGPPVGNGELTEATKRTQVEAHLAALSPEALQRLAGLGPKAAARELTPTLNGQGLQVSERYVQQILDEFLAAQRRRK